MLNYLSSLDVVYSQNDISFLLILDLSGLGMEDVSHLFREAGGTSLAGCYRLCNGVISDGQDVFVSGSPIAAHDAASGEESWSVLFNPEILWVPGLAANQTKTNSERFPRIVIRGRRGV